MPKQLAPSPTEAISDTMQNYLAAMYRIGHGKLWVSTTMLAEQLAVSGPAAVRMIHRLSKRGLVEHRPYQGVRLTDAGRKAALLGLRRHRLAERFLVDVLKFGWHEVHDEAATLQAGLTPAIEARMDALMDYPATCPHGEPIPSPNGEIAEPHDRPLTVVLAGAKGTISRIKVREGNKLEYLAQIGLLPGTPFELVSRAPFNGPLRLRLGRNEQVVGAEMAAAVWVDCLSPGSKG